ncbi:hypothetical protein J5N97_022726 [Dioscorea zingiberensis]|uniref:RING-type E3 ubiquitin transferase n=1 Tax=Dioscorea zingiberensis TaxID=325984 RepID=A0A9D5CBG1_9LILI|nr:hypothetical protein J5N97_022726 [Dioscorea zingiberensis]
MLWLVLLGLFMICAGMSLVFSIYLCLLWLATISNTPPTSSSSSDANKPVPRRLSQLELEQLAGDQDGLAVGGAECAVCLDDIEAVQRAVVLPSCHHSFHVDCAHTWLSSHPHCPLCRASLLPPLPTTTTTTTTSSESPPS